MLFLESHLRVCLLAYILTVDLTVSRLVSELLSIALCVTVNSFLDIVY